MDMNEKYQRIINHVNFENLWNTRLIFVGTGASSHLIEWLCRLGFKKFTLIDIDIVEQKNLATQNFTLEDVGSAKVTALAKRLEQLHFEKDNPNVPQLDVVTYHQDFLSMSDDEVMQGDEQKVLILASDYHPVQAKGSRLSIKYDIPSFWVGIYREGMAGEIVFYDTADGDLPCYRCITQSRYSSFDSNWKKPKAGLGRSSGLPMAATLIDSVLGHLIVGAVHVDDPDNQHGRLYKRLRCEGKNLIQMQFSPEYRLGTEDIFSQIYGKDVVTFNTLFQSELKNHDCPDCQHFKNNMHTTSTDYTRYL
ncbi:ThiF family adenylyltransferase [Aeromonas sp. QDB11]|uniref:ThiF family adenylyltransferase n=1 Tax=Aeromonas sp. QDB11 TaxID=2990482 RepID=UPI0022E497B3|nr:ThiF family adenylyltransferase [Aeromonas sp. QDB11]